MQFIIRARSEGGPQIGEALRRDVSHLKRFATALIAARPDLAAESVYWRLHFCLSMVHNNRVVELDRLDHLSGGATGRTGAETLLSQMLDFAEAGFRA
jgi:hypothetical protein